MKRIKLQLDTDSEICILFRRLYSFHGELNRKEYFGCAFFLFIPYKLLGFLLKIPLIVLALHFEVGSSGILIKIVFWAAEVLIDLTTFVYPYFVIVVKRLRFIGYMSKTIMFFILVIILVLAVVSILDLDVKILLAVYFVPPAILLLKFNDR